MSLKTALFCATIVKAKCAVTRQKVGACTSASSFYVTSSSYLFGVGIKLPQGPWQEEGLNGKETARRQVTQRARE